MSFSSSPQQPNTISLPPPQPSSEPTKKSQPIPWSHQETLALIQAYQDKWYSLNKGQLKAFQWEQVVLSVAELCGLQEPSKTSTQCRHKIEKLRKRYRQECTKPYPDSWQYFQLMDQMERGPNAPFINYNNRVNTSNNVIAPRMVSNNNSHSRGGVESESDEEWSVSNSKRISKSKSINNIVRNNDNGNANDRFVGVLRDRRSGKRKDFYYSSEEEEEEGYNNSNNNNNNNNNYYNYNDVVAAVEKYEAVGLEEEEEEEGEGDGVGRELAKEIRGFAESFVRMESRKIEMLREKERRRMEMEKKRMEMITGAQRKVVETIGRAFATNKKPRMG